MCALKCVYFERIQSSSKWAILRTNEWNRKEFFYLSTDAIKRTFAGCFALLDIRLTDQPKAHGLITLTLINTTRRADWRTCHPTRHFRCLLQVYHTDDEQTMRATHVYRNRPNDSHNAINARSYFVTTKIRSRLLPANANFLEKC